MTASDALLHDYLRNAAERWPEKEALVCAKARHTYADLDARADRLAATLARGGVGRGDRVVVFEDNTMEAAVSFFGALRANAIVSLVSPQTRADKLAYILSDCTPAAVVARASLRPTVEEAVLASKAPRTIVLTGDGARELAHADARAMTWDDALARPEPPPRRVTIDVDLASIIYTSGSTGVPKGVMLTHRNMLTAATSLSTYLGVRQDDVIFCALPMSFDYGLYQMIMAFRNGARLILERGFTYPAEAMQRVQDERVTAFPGVPTMFAVLGERPALVASLDLSSVRFVTNTAAALGQKHIDILKRTFPGAKIFSMYGLTECKRVSYLPPEDIDRKPSSVGVAIPNTEVWIEVDGHRVGPNVVGELVVRGATVMAGYWGDPEATARRLHPGPVAGERVLHTGDQCYLDDEGYLYFVARSDDVIKSRGEKVAPKEVELAIAEVPGVKECAVVGVADEVLGQAIKAFVVLEQGAKVGEDELRRECQRRLEPFKVPKQFAIVAELPKTTTGKIKKTGLA